MTRSFGKVWPLSSVDAEAQRASRPPALSWAEGTRRSVGASAAPAAARTRGCAGPQPRPEFTGTAPPSKTVAPDERQRSARLQEQLAETFCAEAAEVFLSNSVLAAFSSRTTMS